MALKIEKLISGAYGLSHDEDARTVLVKGALEGEIVIPHEVVKRANTFIVEDYDILKPSPLRIAPRCPHYGKCGGCDFLSVDEEVSAALKESMVKENLLRITKLESLPFFLPPAHSSFFSYRSRCRLHVDVRNKGIGFLKRNSNELFALDHCPVLTDRINNLLREKSTILRNAQRQRILSGQNRRTGFVEIAVQDGDEDISISEKAVIAAGYQVNPYCFFQSNLRLLPELLSFVKENSVGNVIMDLYSGVGTFSKLFENEGRKVYAVEKNPRCLSFSKRNAPHALSFTDDAFLFSKRVKEKVDTVIVDPPRIGLERDIIPLISSWDAERMIYVSCDSTTAARDLALFSGYKIICAKLFDFYPGSFHEECAFVLERK